MNTDESNINYWLYSVRKTIISMQYYYHDGKEQKGPYTLNELISIGVKKDTKIWHEGLENWKDAGELEEFKDLLKGPSTPPPFQQEKIASPPPFVKPEAKTAPPKPAAQKPAPKKGNYSGAIIAFAIIGVLATAAFLYSQYNQANGGGSTTGSGSFDSAPAETYEEKKMSLAEQEAAYPTNFLSADGTYRETLIGRKFALEIDIKSTATVAIYKDIQIMFTYYSRTNTQLSTETYTFFEYVSPGKTTHISTKISKPDGASQVGWEVIGATASN